MHQISRQEFTERFAVVVPAWEVHGIQSQAITLERDAEVSGILKKGLLVRSGAKVIAHGIVEGAVEVEPGAVLYLNGIVKGPVHVGGAACIRGIIGSLVADDDAVICLNAIESAGNHAA